MPIRLEDLATTDYSDVATGQVLALVRPGDVLLHEFMEPLGLSANALATALHVPANRITAIVAGQRGITADTALRLARYFGMSPEFWINLQSQFDLALASRQSGSRILQEVAVRAAG